MYGAKGSPSKMVIVRSNPFSGKTRLLSKFTYFPFPFSPNKVLSEQGDDLLSEPDDKSYHEEDEEAEAEEEDDAPCGLAVDGLYGGLVAFHKSADECHVLLVALVEDVDEITDIEGNHAEQDVAQRVVENRHGEGKGADLHGTERNIDEGDDSGYGIADASRDGKAQGRIEVVAVHHVGELLKPLVGTARGEALLKAFAFLFFHNRLQRYIFFGKRRGSVEEKW